MRHKIKPIGDSRVVSILADGEVLDLYVCDSWTSKKCNYWVARLASQSAKSAKKVVR